MEAAVLNPVVEIATNWLDSKEHARKTHSILHEAWWQAWRCRTNKVPEAVEAERLMKSAMAKVKSEAIAKFGVQSDCSLCREYSVFGGPGHNASPRCRSGRHPHCSCDTCW